MRKIGTASRARRTVAHPGPVYAWPPQPVVDVSLFAPVPYSPAFSADWHVAAEERDRQSPDICEASVVSDLSQRPVHERREFCLMSGARLSKCLLQLGSCGGQSNPHHFRGSS